MENLSTLFVSSQKKVCELKMQMVYRQDAIKNVEAELAVLRKKLRKVEDDLRRHKKLLSESLVAQWEIEEKIKDLKLSLVLSDADSPKSDYE